MVGVGEGLVPPEGPPTFHERQITPGEFESMVRGQRPGSGSSAELVEVGSEASLRVIIDDVNRTYRFGERPDPGRVATPEDKTRWYAHAVDRPWVTLYTESGEGAAASYDYDHYPAWQLGLAPRVTNSGLPPEWPQDITYYLRWPEQPEAA